MPIYTSTQGRYLAFIHAYIGGFGLPPSEAEIAQTLGVTPPSVNRMMKALEQKGFIRRQSGKARSTEILIPPAELPKWESPIQRTITVRDKTVLQGSAVRKPPRSPKGVSTIYQLKITLRGTKPPIWRRIETADVNLATLHELIQAAMGWTDSHLYQFEIGDRYYTDLRMIDGGFNAAQRNSKGVRLSHLVKEYGPKWKVNYVYDFGDNWEHWVALEKIKAAEPHQQYPRCAGGQLACPPEDVGGVWGFEEYLEAIANPDHEEHEDRLEWAGPFDPDDFDPEQATQAMR